MDRTIKLVIPFGVGGEEIPQRQCLNAVVAGCLDTIKDIGVLGNAVTGFKVTFSRSRLGVVTPVIEACLFEALPDVKCSYSIGIPCTAEKTTPLAEDVVARFRGEGEEGESGLAHFITQRFRKSG